MMGRFTVLLILLAGCTSSVQGERQRVIDLAEIFDGAPGTFAAMNLETGERVVYNPQRAAAGFIPASTYKIPNSIIALETGVVPPEGLRLDWDSERNPRQPWWPPAWSGSHELSSAFRQSVVWYYQEVARRIGSQRMQDWIGRLDYGNRDMSGGLDQFWLSGGMRISAVEQVEFLARLWRGELPIAESTARQVREMMLLDSDGTTRLSGKTGTSTLAPGRHHGWLVGAWQRDGQTWVYAMNMEGASTWPGPLRQQKVKQMFERVIER
jgi:beta-lactamase class D